MRPISNPQAGSSSDIELPILTSHARSFQPPLHGQVSSSSPIAETNPENRTVNPAAVVDEIEPPIPAYFPPSNHIPPTLSFDAGLLEYTRMHGHSEIPLSPRQREDDRSSVQASEAQADALPSYKLDNPPVYSRRPTQHELQEPSTWPMLCFKLGFVFPLFWLCGGLTLISPSISPIFTPWFRDFVPESECDDNFQTEADKEAYLARFRAAEITWAKRCSIAFTLVLGFVIAIAVTIIAITKVS
ncbi:hypothetical protein BYT27DRAFT_7148154 [Phlegmacium glaucopus]|nr:hypothetical protein BYT27DRAFT_7148154 [Phlegmacium glaucopus]